jgi:hypothetical protein
MTDCAVDAGTRAGTAREHGFAQDDVAVEIDYGSVEEAIATYGFIYGEPAIDYLLGRGTSKINWSLRLCQRIA